MGSNECVRAPRLPSPPTTLTAAPPTQGLSFLEMCGLPVMTGMRKDPAAPLVVIRPLGMISYAAMLMWNFVGVVLVTSCTPERWLEQAMLCCGMINDCMYFIWPMAYYGGKIDAPESWVLMKFDSTLGFIAQMIPMYSFVGNCAQVRDSQRREAACARRRRRQKWAGQGG